MTSRSVNLAPPFLIPTRPLFLRVQSCWLSNGVPANKCSGLTHLRLSHLWQTCIFSGISLLARMYEYLCAMIGCLWVRLNSPYPLRLMCPSHSQQSPIPSPGALLTFVQNLLAVSELRTRCTGLQHRGSEQVCLTRLLFGISPLDSKYAVLCACLSKPLWYGLNLPLPLLTQPVHNQHSFIDRLSTLLQNLWSNCLVSSACAVRRRATDIRFSSTMKLQSLPYLRLSSPGRSQLAAGI